MVILKHAASHPPLLVGWWWCWCLFCSIALLPVLVSCQTGPPTTAIPPPSPPSTSPSSSSWCVARSDATDQALQAALDYACSAGADCVPIQSSGLCYLPNTLIAHASYAFNSYYQRKAMAPGSCNFAGTATVAKTDPSYGSCVYPSSLSTAGGSMSPGGSNPPPPPGGSATPLSNAPPPPPTVATGGTSPVYGGFTPGVPTSQNSKAAALQSSVPTAFIILLPLLLAIPLVCEPN